MIVVLRRRPLESAKAPAADTLVNHRSIHACRFRHGRVFDLVVASSSDKLASRDREGLVIRCKLALLKAPFHQSIELQFQEPVFPVSFVWLQWQVIVLLG